jgi:hypothetical protein
MGRNRASLEKESVLRFHEIAVGFAVVNETIQLLAGIFFRPRELQKRHFQMVFVTERMDSNGRCYTRHEETSSPPEMKHPMCEIEHR